jgi:hypothetical protein
MVRHDTLPHWGDDETTTPMHRIGEHTEPIVLDTTQRPWRPVVMPARARTYPPRPRPPWADGVVLGRRR